MQSASHSGGRYFGVGGVTGAAGAGAGAAAGAGSAGGAGAAGAAGSEGADSLPAPPDVADEGCASSSALSAPGAPIGALSVCFEGISTFVSAPLDPSSSEPAPPPQATANVRTTAELIRTNFMLCPPATPLWRSALMFTQRDG